MKYLKYFYYILKHKYYVGYALIKYYRFYRLAVLHDWSKFTSLEFVPCANHFFGKEVKDSRSDKSFDLAFFYHKSRNKHHYQFWTVVEYNQMPRAVDMPIRYIKEMICDWEAMSKVLKTNTTPKEWFEKNKSKMILSQRTLEVLHVELRKLYG